MSLMSRKVVPPHNSSGKKNSSNCKVVGCRSGNPLFLEPYWRRNAAAGDVVLSPWHRLGYITTDGGYQSVELERLIRRLHKAVGNAVVDDKHIVFGAGRRGRHAVHGV
jgi:hypothetical protein